MGGDPFLTLVHFDISQDRMSATLTLEEGIELPRFSAEYVIARSIMERLPQHAHVHKAIRAAISLYAQQAGARTQLVIAQGTAPTDPIDESIELTAGSPSPTHATPTQSPPPTIVKAWQVVAFVRPSRLGTDGVDVFSKPVPVRLPKKVTLDLDDSLVRASGGRIIAAKSGLLEATPPRFRIKTTLELLHRVELATGNIDFPGDIAIHHGVADAMHITAGGSITIRDLVDGATIHATRNLTLAQGMAASKHGSLECGVDLAARYLTNIKGVVGRTATIDADVTDCQLTIGHSLIAPNSRVIRGELLVAHACEVRELGTEAVSSHGHEGETSLILGHLPAIDAGVHTADDLLHRCQSINQRANQQLKALKARVGKITPAQAEKQTELTFSLKRIETIRATIVKRFARLLNSSQQHTTIRLTVQGHIHKGVVLWLGPLEAHVTAPIRGPVRITFDEHGHPVVTDLATHQTVPLTRYARVQPTTRFPPLLSLAETLGLSALVAQPAPRDGAPALAPPAHAAH